VVANDMDLQRCWLLTARLRSIGNAAANAVVTCHSAHRMPNVATTDDEEERYPEGPYDRIICDVPCSGDGTLRKDPKCGNSGTRCLGSSCTLSSFKS